MAAQIADSERTHQIGLGEDGQGTVVVVVGDTAGCTNAEVSRST
jgi:hypothetical protein